MTPTHREELTWAQLDAIAWRFLRSAFTGQIYANWPIDRRVDAYLLHHGPAQLLNDGSNYDALVECIMANVGAALRTGILQSPNGKEAS
nr:hypothetical protein [Mycobacterium sp.]